MLLFKEMMLLNQYSISNAQNSITPTPSKTNSEAIVRMSIVIVYWFLSDEHGGGYVEYSIFFSLIRKKY